MGCHPQRDHQVFCKVNQRNYKAPSRHLHKSSPTQQCSCQGDCLNSNIYAFAFGNASSAIKWSSTITQHCSMYFCSNKQLYFTFLLEFTTDQLTAYQHNNNILLITHFDNQIICYGSHSNILGKK